METKELTTDQIELLFQMFCSTDHYRENLQSPFKIDGMYCATDGISIVWVKEQDANLSFEENPDAPDVHKVLPKDSELYKNSIIIDLKKLSKEILENKLPEFETCTDCRGSGFLTCDLDHEHECTNCDETGKQQSLAVYDFGIETGKMRPQLLHRMLNFCYRIGETTILMTKGKPDKSWCFEAGIFNIILMPYMVSDDDDDEYKYYKIDLKQLQP